MAEKDRIKITEIRTHKNPSIDEWVAIWLLFIFGIDKYYIGEHTKIVFDTKTDVSNWKKERRQRRKKGRIFLGTGGGQFDEHPWGKKKRKKGECCATLMAFHLGVERRNDLKQILTLALNDDLGIGPKDAAGRNLAHFALPRMIKKMYQNDVRSLDEVQARVFDDLNEVYQSQVEFFDNYSTLQEAEKLEFKNDQHTVRVVSALTENESFSKYAFAKSNVDLVLQLRKSGNWQLFCRRDSVAEKYMVQIAAAIKLGEARASKISFKKSHLTREGFMKGLKHIYFFEAGKMIFNGSSTHDVKPSLLRPGQILRIIEWVIVSSEEKKQQEGILPKTRTKLARAKAA